MCTALHYSAVRTRFTASTRRTSRLVEEMARQGRAADESNGTDERVHAAWMGCALSSLVAGLPWRHYVLAPPRPETLQGTNYLGL